MPDKPILIFPAPTVAARVKLPQSFGPPGPRPTHAQQRTRLASRFQALGQRFGAIQADVAGADPEQVIVFETIGSVGDFQNVVKRIPGMEWLGDFDADIAEPDPGFLADGSEETQLPGRLFVVASNRSAYNELLRLWRAWCRAADEKLERGFGPLAKVFKHLQDVRSWGPKDRVRDRSPGIVGEGTGLELSDHSVRGRTMVPYGRNREGRSIRPPSGDRGRGRRTVRHSGCDSADRLPRRAVRNPCTHRPADRRRDQCGQRHETSAPDRRQVLRSDGASSNSTYGGGHAGAARYEAITDWRRRRGFA